MPLPDEPTQYVIQRIREALAADPRVGELGIDVEVARGKVFLRGAVATDERRQAISDVVSEMFPDCEIHNETKVEELQEPDAVENL